MSRFDFYKESYYKEFDRKETLNAALGTPIALITAIGAWVFYLLLNFDFKWEFSSYALVISIVIIAISLIVAVRHLTLSYYAFRRIKSLKFDDGYIYSYIPGMEDNETFYQNVLNDYGKEVADQEFEKYLIRKYIECADKNFKLNVNKADYILYAKKTIILALIGSVFSFIVYIGCFSVSYKLKKQYQQTKILDTVKVIEIKK